ncbi:hypothetical protein [Nocardia sp. NPDC004750]
MSIDGLGIARDLVRERFSRARAAWLGGSTVNWSPSTARTARTTRER